MKSTSIFLVSLAFSYFLFSQDQQIQLANEYFQQGDLDKSKIMYKELAKDVNNIPLIASNYLSILKSIGDYSTAEKFTKSAIRHFPSNLQFHVSLMKLYQLQSQDGRVEEYEKILLDRYYSFSQLSILAQYLVNEELYDVALVFFKEARSLVRDPSIYALEMASIYRIQNNKSEMIEEYLRYASQSVSRMRHVKNILQNILQEEEDVDELEGMLIRKVQDNPDQVIYGELLVWVELQRKNFYGAFIQARAIDKRNNDPGSRSMDVGQIAMDNRAWDDAVEIFGYVAKQYRGTANYSLARKYMMEAKEHKIKSTFPVNRDEIRLLGEEYQVLYEELAPSQTSLELLRRKALLHAFYLNEIDSATSLLLRLINMPRVNRILIANAKLDLGDVYLLQGIYWEATLLYSQVEKSHKVHSLGYDAKLRNARLHYFMGNFALAKGHLDILKTNTAREISNDAISLGMLITDNTVLDTTDQVMQEFASIELQIFQNNKLVARDRLVKMLEKYKHHSISDEVYWLLSELELAFGNILSSIDYLDKILAAYSHDILADDAAFKKAEIYDYQLKDKEQAKAFYRDFLVDYPGSMFASQARKRFRQLRGDFIN